MMIESKRIGTVEVDESRVIHFNDGLLGFPTLRQFFLADDPVEQNIPFKWLISVENPELMFLVTDPGLFFKDYVFDLPEDDRKYLLATSPEDISVICILTVPADPKQITANLKGPLIINWKTLVGRQVVLKDMGYETKHFIFIQRPTETAATTSGGNARATSGGKGVSRVEIPNVSLPVNQNGNSALGADSKV